MAVDYKKEGRIAIFTINRPEAMNALNDEVHREFTEAILDFRDDPELWVAIITGVGDKAFSAGADLKRMGARRTGEAGAGEARARTLEPATVFGLVDKIWKPFIAAINGYALGGGLELALSCDLRIAAEHARLGLPEILRGITAGGGGLWYLPRFISRAHAAQIILMGQHIDAQEAYRMGIVNKVVPLDQLMPTARQWAETICQAAPLAVSVSKQSMLRGYDVTVEQARRLYNDLSPRVFASEDGIEGVRAFAEKRKPVWKGR